MKIISVYKVKNDSRRIIKRFQWWPKRLLMRSGKGSAWRFLETVKVRQAYWMTDHMKSKWFDLSWEDI